MLAVDYSLAPENKFPAALEECYAVLFQLNKYQEDWMTGTGQFANQAAVDISKIVLAGVGSGGNLAISSFLLWHDRSLDNEITPRTTAYHQHPTHFFHEKSSLEFKRLLLVHPDLFNIKDDSAELLKNEENLFINEDIMAQYQKFYLGFHKKNETLWQDFKERRKFHPYICATAYDRLDSSVFSRVYFVAALNTLLHHDSSELNQMLNEDYNVTSGMYLMMLTPTGLLSTGVRRITDLYFLNIQLATELSEI